MPDASSPPGADDGTVNARVPTSNELSTLAAHVASLDLDPPTLEILMAALTIDLTEEEIASLNTQM